EQFVELFLDQLHAHLILKLCLGKHHAFAIDIHVVAVRPFRQVHDVHAGRLDPPFTAGVHHLLHRRMKIDVLGVITRRIDIRHVGGDKLLAIGCDLHKSLQDLKQRSCSHYAYLLGGRPYSRILLRRVRRLMPSISAACVRFPSVKASVCSRCCRSRSRIGVPGTAAGSRFAVGAAGFRRVAECEWNSASKQPASISVVPLSVITRRMKFANSRTLPGEECVSSRSRKSECSRGMLILLCNANCSAKCAASTGMSSRRSRKGGSESGITFSR